MRTAAMRMGRPLLLGAIALVGFPACEKRSAPAGPAAAEVADAGAPSAAPARRAIDGQQLALFASLPAKMELPTNLVTDAKVALGRMLFFDARLSKGGDVACSSCHDPAHGGAEARPTTIGTGGQEGKLNAPSVLDAAGYPELGWAGRAETVESFVVPHAAEPSTMAADGARLTATLRAIPGYAAPFAKAFPETKGAIDTAAVGNALAAYLRRLLTPSRWDRFLSGETSALTDAETAGLAAFLDASCATCHAGKYLGATMNQKLGLAKPWPPPTGDDPGRFALTKEDVDRGVFRVPGLRNVAKTAPYLHDGSVASLEETVRLMERHQVGRELPAEQAKSIVTFLGALSGEPPAELVGKPELPGSAKRPPARR